MFHINGDSGGITVQGTGNWGAYAGHPLLGLGPQTPDCVDLDVVPAVDEIDAQRTPKTAKTRLEYKAEMDTTP